MSKIIAKVNPQTQNWEVTVDDLEPRSADLCIGFIGETNIIDFYDLKLNYELRQNDNIKLYGVFPRPGVRYLKSNQEFVVVEHLEFEMETDYELYLWAENNKESFETTATFTTPRPKQPHDSWLWEPDTRAWEPPIPKPDDVNEYEWNDETQSWDKIIINGDKVEKV